ncbi:lactate dehydrogenase [Salipiger sp. CCB-MM3]|uniref:FAD-binding oxidoreductase n=1 Tax=Salipiger sp. CCB-MM3 TaxID=1792508 RepID=UPI00080AAACD|nr:FAD-linked oxidase C-terminal domain-containing protein [Salipiger sp. CCB-MM3]ANT59838.1 lactate dehydrogenase [Salipiger sp. CCB-MM3]
MTQHETAFAELDAAFPGRIERSEAVRAQHGAGDSWHPAALPDAVFMAQSTEEVAQAVRICAAHGCPIVPFGAGSCIEGQVNATQGGLCIDLSSMDKVLRVSPEDMDCSVQAGLTRQRLNEDLRATGLFLPIDIGAHATLGGMASTRASGTMTVRHGTMADLVMGLTVVLPDGQIVRTGGRARKSSSGYDLTHLFIGAEGTLGIITELTLRLTGIPEASKAGLYSFASIEAATQTVVEALQFGLCLNRIELMDTLQVKAINAYNKVSLPEQPTLLVDLAGSQGQVEADRDTFDALADENGAEVHPVDTPEQYAKAWALRHSALYAARGLRPGCSSLSTDVCVPVSELPRILTEIEAVLQDEGIVAPMHGHVGDGNFHLVMLFDPESVEEKARVQKVHGQLVARAIELGGTATGEHGVGLGKKSYMEAEHGAALALMKTLKRAVDPANLMNPGKIFDL